MNETIKKLLGQRMSRNDRHLEQLRARLNELLEETRGVEAEMDAIDKEQAELRAGL